MQDLPPVTQHRRTCSPRDRCWSRTARLEPLGAAAPLCAQPPASHPAAAIAARPSALRRIVGEAHRAAHRVAPQHGHQRQQQSRALRPVAQCLAAVVWNREPPSAGTLLAALRPVRSKRWPRFWQPDRPVPTPPFRPLQVEQQRAPADPLAQRKPWARCRPRENPFLGSWCNHQDVPGSADPTRRRAW